MALKRVAVCDIQSLEKFQENQAARLKETLTKMNNQNSSKFEDDFDDLDLQTLADGGGANYHDGCTRHSTKENTESVSSSVNLSANGAEFASTESSVGRNYLQKEVERLQLQLSKKNSEVKQHDKEIEKLRQTLEEERKVMSEAGLTSSVTQKIVEISRKNRDLHAELGREKHKTRQLQTQVTELKDLKQKHEAYIEEFKKGSSSEPTLEEKQKQSIAKLEEQLAQAKHKVVEHSNHVQRLKQDLKLAQKVLLKEVGDGASISNLASTGEGWRGRAQTILTLQNKIAELQKQIESQSKSGRLSAVGHKTPTLTENKQKTVVQKIETENKQKLQELKTEVQTLNLEQGELKQTIKAVKSRNQTLTLEVKEYKAQINSLSNELKEKEKVISCLEEKLIYSERSTKPNDYEDTIRLLRSQLSHSNGEKQRLEQSVSELQRKLVTKQQTPPPSTPPQLSTSSTSDNDSFEPLSSEASSLHLPPIKGAKKSSKQKMDSKSLFIRSSISAGNMPVPPQRTYSNEEFDQVVSLCRVTEVERDRLLGLSQLLQQRLDTAYTELATIKQQLTNSLRGGGGGGGDVPVTTRTKIKPPPIATAEDNKLVSELKTKLSLQEDENNVLKETLKLTREQKLKDMKMLQNLFHETRQNLRT